MSLKLVLCLSWQDLWSVSNSNTIRALNQIYVRMNKQGQKDNNNRILEMAKAKFNELERGDEKLRKQWAFIRKLTVQDLKDTYRRLNVRIDHYHGESMYGQKADQQLQKLREAKILSQTEDGRQVVDLDDKRRVVITKSDGSSLYMTRDLAAAVERQQEFQVIIILLLYR